MVCEVRLTGIALQVRAQPRQLFDTSQAHALPHLGQELTCFHGILEGDVVVLHELHKGMLREKSSQADMPGCSSHVSWGERRLRFSAM